MKTTITDRIDIFLCDILNHWFIKRPQDLEHLKRKINVACREIPAEVLQNDTDKFYSILSQIDYKIIYNWKIQLNKVILIDFFTFDCKIFNI